MPELTRPHIRSTRRPSISAVCIMAFVVTQAGCLSTTQARKSPPLPVPRELAKVTMPDYVIEPPDVLQIDLLIAVPKPPYRIQPLDVLAVRVPDALPESPIGGAYPVDPDGTIGLGVPYGNVTVAGMTLDEAKAAVEEQLLQVLVKPSADIALAQGRAVQQVRGPHLVRPDGSIGLGTYGSVRVVGMTIGGARQAIEAHLAEFFQNPEVAVDITGYNSKVYYVVTDGAGAGQQVARLPSTGNETVLDAVAQIAGLSVVSDKHRIWVARPSPVEVGCTTVLPVDWRRITEIGDTKTNYQLLPGDRLFVSSLPAVEFDVRLARLLAPFERLMGFTLLGAGTVQTLQNFPAQNGGFGGGFGTGVIVP